jgi:hypothetical protein
VLSELDRSIRGYADLVEHLTDYDEWDEAFNLLVRRETLQERLDLEDCPSERELSMLRRADNRLPGTVALPARSIPFHLRW